MNEGVKTSRLSWLIPVFILLFVFTACTEKPDVTIENDTLRINALGYEESCVTPSTVHFNVAGQWREATFLPYQGPYYLDRQYIDQPRENLGCYVVGICNLFHERTISLSDLGYEKIGWVDNETGQNVQAFETLPPPEEIQVHLKYYSDEDCQRAVQYDTTITLTP